MYYCTASCQSSPGHARRGTERAARTLAAFSFNNNTVGTFRTVGFFLTNDCRFLTKSSSIEREQTYAIASRTRRLIAKYFYKLKNKPTRAESKSGCTPNQFTSARARILVDSGILDCSYEKHETAVKSFCDCLLSVRALSNNVSLGSAVSH